MAKGAEFDRRVAFRDRLNQDAPLRAEYETLKCALAVRDPKDREGYTEAKAAFIKRVLAS